MFNRKWTFTIVFIFILFAWLTGQFIISLMNLHRLVEPLRVNPSSPNAPESRRVVLIAQERDNYFWRAIERGAREAAEQNGMELAYMGPDRINPEEQIKLLDKAILVKPDGILVQGLNDPRYGELIDRAAGQGIPVITVDTDEPGAERLAYVGTDNEAAGKQMGRLVMEASGQQGSIGVLIGNAQAENQKLRLAGFRSAISRYSGFKIIEVASSEISRLQAAQTAEAMLLNHPEIRYMVGFSSMDGPGIVEASERIGKGELRIFAFDDPSETLEAFQNGDISAVVVQQPVEMGKKAIGLLGDYFEGLPTADATFTETTELRNGTVAKENPAGSDLR